jgi:hypothetical protein
MKQKVISAESYSDMKDRLEDAMSYGWYIQSVVYGDGAWLAILMKDEE